MNTAEFTTVEEALLWAEHEFTRAELFYGHGTDNAWDEAAWLLMASLSMKELVNVPLDETQQEIVLTLFRRRINEKIPAAYLLNQAFFAGREFYVDERVIIPRSPIAELIQKHFQPWVALDRVKNILDLCCGSACIAIACAYEFPNSIVDAVDIDDDALAVAKINLEKHHMLDQVHLIKSNLFASLEGKCYDIIVTNPPYVDAEDMADMPAEFHHEPALALAAGKDGLLCADIILAQAKKHLTEDGILILEVGNSAAALEAKYPKLPFIWLEFEFGGDGVALLRAKDLS